MATTGKSQQLFKWCAADSVYPPYPINHKLIYSVDEHKDLEVTVSSWSYHIIHQLAKVHKSSDFICRTVSSSPQKIRIHLMYISLVQSKVTIYCSWSTVRALSCIQYITEQVPSTKKGILNDYTPNYKTMANLTSSLPNYIGLNYKTCYS